MANELIESIPLQNLHVESDVSATASSEAVVATAAPDMTPLCERCSMFDIQAFARVPHQSRGYKWSDVEESATSKCRFCLLLLDSVRDLDPPNPFYVSTFGLLKPRKPDLYIHMKLSKNYETATREMYSPLNFNRLHAAIGGRFDEVRSHSKVELCVTADPDSPAAREGFISGRYYGRDLNNKAYWKTIEGWLNECAGADARGHEKCRETASGLERLARDAPVMPIRCIRVDIKNGNPIALEDTEHKTKLYITLTHRWDSDKSTKTIEACQTTMTNIKDRQNGKELDNLPEHFRDAFKIAAKLNVEYVWIDSLCIIQAGDDGHDLGLQMSKMAQFYQHSLLTIATTANDYLTESMLRDSKTVPWSNPPVQLQYRSAGLPTEAAGHFYAFKRRRTLVDDYWENVRSTEIFNRAWILQEWMLSKRFLWYTPEGMFFECHSLAPRTPAGEQISPETRTQELHYLFNLKQRLHWTNASILDFWYDAIEVNSTFSISRTSDRVPAIAGLAYEVANIIAAAAPGERQHDKTAVRRVVYIAGMWLQDIHRGLLWEVDSCAPDATRSVEGVPSWSWISYLAPVKFPKPDLKVCHEMVVVGLCLQKQTRGHEPQWKCANDKITNMPPEGLFDLGSNCSCLHIEGVIQPVWIRGYLQQPKEIETVAFGTCYGKAPKAGRWRAIHAEFDDDVIIGWTSVERLPGKPDVCDDYGSKVLALHVSTRYFTVGWILTRSFPVIDLLFLRENPGRAGVYERIGVGRIFGNSTIQRFRAAAKINAQLI